MEYYDLIEKAVQSTDWVERICYVAAFAVSGYASTKFRSGRKGLSVPIKLESITMLIDLIRIQYSIIRRDF